jgi:hypothetical protein
MNMWQGIFGVLFIAALGALIWIFVWEIMDR